MAELHPFETSVKSPALPRYEQMLFEADKDAPTEWREGMQRAVDELEAVLKRHA